MKTRDESEDRDAVDAARRRKDLRRAYAQAIRAGGPLADVLTQPERLTPGSVGYNAQHARELLERKQTRKAQKGDRRP